MMHHLYPRPSWYTYSAAKVLTKLLHKRWPMDCSAHDESHRLRDFEYNINLTKQFKKMFDMHCDKSENATCNANRPKLYVDDGERFGWGYVGASKPNLKLNNN